jgi:hypothetical protein
VKISEPEDGGGKMMERRNAGYILSKSKGKYKNLHREPQRSTELHREEKNEN